MVDLQKFNRAQKMKTYIKKNALLFVATLLLSFLLFRSGNFLDKDNSFLTFKIKEENNEEPRNGFPDEAMKFYFEQRAYPTGEIPVDWRAKALEQIRINKLKKSGIQKSAALNWTELGPNNIGGRIRTILINPSNHNVIYAGAVSGGVWRSTNGGDSWEPLGDKMANLAVCSMCLNPKNSKTIWAGTGEGFFNYDAIRGEGIFRSTDGGESWTQLSSTKNVNFQFVNKLAYDTTTSTLWAATRKGLFKSTNNGNTFTPVIIGQNKGDIHCTDLEIAYSTPTKIFAAFGLFNQSAIYRSTDGGANFSQNYSENGYGRIEIAVSESDPNVVYASLMKLQTNGIGKFIKSEDGGETWTSLVVPGPSYSGSDNYAGKQGWYNNIIGVNPVDPYFLLVGGIDLWGSDDGGSSWNQISNWYNAQGYQYIHADIHAVAFDPSNPDIVYVGTDGGVFKSTNGGFNWSEKNNNLNVTQFYYGAVSPDCRTLYGGTQDNGTLKSSNSLSWGSVLGGDGGAVEIDFNTPTTVFMEYVKLAIFKSTNGGVTINKAMTGIPTGSGFWDGTTDRTLFISPFTMDPNDSKILVAGTYRIWKTTNSGSYWNAISGDLTGDGEGDAGAKISAVAIAAGNSNVIYAGCSNGVVQVTTDNGNNWTKVTTGLPNLYCTRISIYKDHPETAVISFSGFVNGKKVYKTTNYGSSWTNISGDLPNIPVNSILIYPKNGNIILAGTDLGIFVTLDGGTSWTQMNNELPNVPVFDLDYCAAQDVVIASTHGRGMFKADVEPLTKVEKENLVKNISFQLEQNYPNPFGTRSKARINRTTISYRLQKAGFVKLTIFDELGRRIKILENSYKAAGTYRNYFNASKLPSGVYFYRLEQNGISQTKKIILIK